MKIIMKISDISNECRPVNVSEQWLDCLLTEFFNQVLKLKFKNDNLSKNQFELLRVIMKN